MSGVDIQERFRGACLRKDAVQQIVGLQLSSPCLIDPSNNNNEALKTAVATENAELINYLLADTRVLECEQQNDFPALRTAIKNESFYVFVIVNALNAKKYELSPDIVELLKQQAAPSASQDNEFTNAVSRVHPHGSELRFSQFAGSVRFNDDYASATGEYRPRGFMRFLCS